MLRRRTTKPFAPPTEAVTLVGRRVLLRPLRPEDFADWQEVRRSSAEWLTQWEPRPTPGMPDTVEDPQAFKSRCSMRLREIQLGTGFGFGVFLAGRFIGEVNLNSIQRGARHNAYIGYWIDQNEAGQGLVPEAVVVALRFAFEDLHLHRVQISIVPRNTASLRVVEKLGLRSEGLAERYLQINGVWEDHLRHAITAEEWEVRGPEMMLAWVD
jgi:ribosomal-protein-alanine N-acetyltransferase